jgi:hypothetical protein
MAFLNSFYLNPAALAHRSFICVRMVYWSSRPRFWLSVVEKCSDHLIAPRSEPVSGLGDTGPGKTFP